MYYFYNTRPAVEYKQENFLNGKISVTDGPFIEGKELIPGYTIIEVNSKQEAVDWTTKLVQCMGSGVVKMAPVFVPGMDK